MSPRARAASAAVAGAMLLAACGGDEPNDQSAPEFAFRAFRRALVAGDVATTWAFLGPETRAALQAEAARYPAGGRPRPEQLLRAALVPGEADIKSLERTAYDDGGAVLRVETHFGHRADVHMLRDESGWRIELALPALEPPPR